MVHRLSIAAAPCAALLVLSLSATAFQTGSNPPPGSSSVNGLLGSIPWSSSVGAGTFTDAASGHFTSTERRDLAQVRGGSVGLAVQIGAYSGTAEFALAGDDLGSLPYTAPALDHLAIVGPQGLVTVEHDATSTGALNGFLVPITTLHEDSDWTTATEMVTHPLDSSDGWDIAAIADGGYTILLAFDDGAGSFTFDDFALSDPADAIAAGQWDGSGDAEIAVATDQGLQIYDLSGTLLHSEFNLSTGDQLVVLPNQKVDSGGAAVSDAFAWLTTHPGNGSQLLVIVGQGFREYPVVTTGMSAVHMAGGQRRSDGLRNLYFNSNGEFTLFVLHNQGGNDTTDVNHHSFILDLTDTSSTAAHSALEYADGPQSPSTIASEVVVADFDGDKVDDIVFAGQPFGQLIYIDGVDGPRVDSSTISTNYENVGLVPDNDCIQFVEDMAGGASGTSGVLTFAIDVPDTLTDGVTDTTHVELVLWEAASENVQASNFGVLHYVIDPTDFPVSTGTPCDGSTVVAMDEHTRALISVPVDPASWTLTSSCAWDEVYYIEWRPVEFDGTDITAVGRTEVVVWNRGGDAEDYSWFDDDFWPLGIDVNIDISSCLGGTLGGEIAPGSRSDLPPIPRPGTITVVTP
ncbi:hypothetical protein [Engelhardtia mirabilis]|uniref:FG-GAP repeat protein n=1 Tax=Engelhardtia mirabilis TaxID=2528011 RepID=A0A518BEL2_9BACT|nr:hypothetical protein Pla133_04850 [Planctomycetes bacterium Pla133]QDU99746.1 hypothetical protein Pla86_04850 [Planctomycetes bacterium Pla86]